MDHHNESLIEYYHRSIGHNDSMMLLLLAAASFALVAVVIFKGKGPTVGPALVLVTPMTAYYGLYSALSGLVVVTRIVDLSGTTPDPNSLVTGFGYSITSFYVGMLLGVPTFLLAVIGAVARALGKQDGK